MQHVDGDDYTYPIDSMGLKLAPGHGASGTYYVTDDGRPWLPTGPERVDRRIAELEQQLADTRLHVSILIARVTALEAQAATDHG